MPPNKRDACYLYVAILDTRGALIPVDDDLAGRPLERRMNRLERVAASGHGEIETRTDNSLLVAFDSANAAVLTACEMQHRCAALPQVSGNRLALRIGITRRFLKTRSNDTPDDPAATAAQLASLDDSILASQAVVDALNENLRKLVQPMNTLSNGIKAQRVFWQSELPTASFTLDSNWPTSRIDPPSGPHLVLNYRKKSIETSNEQPVIRIGRDNTNDLVCPEDHVSRAHCMIEKRDSTVILIDISTNGTCVAPDGGSEFIVKRNTSELRGSGLIFPGRPSNGERRGGIRFKVY